MNLNEPWRIFAITNIILQSCRYGTWNLKQYIFSNILCIHSTKLRLDASSGIRINVLFCGKYKWFKIFRIFVNPISFSGMWCGAIYVHNFPSLDPHVVLKMHTDCVLDIQLSMNQKYFASCDSTGFVLVWYTKTFTAFVKCYEASEALIAWHPWKEDDLIIGRYKFTFILNQRPISSFQFKLLHCLEKFDCSTLRRTA